MASGSFTTHAGEYDSGEQVYPLDSISVPQLSRFSTNQSQAKRSVLAATKISHATASGMDRYPLIMHEIKAWRLWDRDRRKSLLAFLLSVLRLRTKPGSRDHLLRDMFVLDLIDSLSGDIQVRIWDFWPLDMQSRCIKLHQSTAMQALEQSKAHSI